MIPEERRRKEREWYAKNREAYLARKKEYLKKVHETNPELDRKFKQRKKIWIQQDPLRIAQYKLKRQLKKSFHRLGWTKRSQTYMIVGCTYEELLEKIGEKPSDAYHLEHICPLTQAKSETELHKLWHHSNLRWMLGSENIAKFNHPTIEAVQKCHEILGREWVG